MEIKEQGQIIELDPSKEYLMFIKVDSLLYQHAQDIRLERKKGGIYFVRDFDEFRFVENSDKIKGVVFEG